MLPNSPAAMHHLYKSQIIAVTDGLVLSNPHCLDLTEFQSAYTALRAINYSQPCNTYSTDEILLTCHYSIAIVELLVSYLDELYFNSVYTNADLKN